MWVSVICEGVNKPRTFFCSHHKACNTTKSSASLSPSLLCMWASSSPKAYWCLSWTASWLSTLSAWLLLLLELSDGYCRGVPMGTFPLFSAWRNSLPLKIIRALSSLPVICGLELTPILLRMMCFLMCLGFAKPSHTLKHSSGFEFPNAFALNNFITLILSNGKMGIGSEGSRLQASPAQVACRGVSARKAASPAQVACCGVSQRGRQRARSHLSEPSVSW